MPTERTVKTRLLYAAFLLGLFEIVLLSDDEGIVFWVGLALATVMGITARLWWLVPLIPTAFILLLNIHLRLFGEIVELPPEYGWEVEFAPFVFAVALWFASLFAAFVGTLIGYACQHNRWQRWAWPYGVPTLLLIGSFVTLMLITGDPGSWWNLPVNLLVAFLIGVLFRPEHVWVTPVVVTILLATTVYWPEMLWGAVRTTAWLAGVVLSATLMIWTGRSVRCEWPRSASRSSV